MKVLLVGLLLMLTACSVIDQGEIGIQTGSFSGKIDPEPLERGMYMTVFSSIIKVDGTQVRVNVDGIQPKDKDNVLIDDVSLTVTYHINKAKAVEFYVLTKEVDQIKENEGGHHINVLGFGILKQVANSSVQNVFKRYYSFEIFPKREEVQLAIAEEVTKELNVRYPGMFTVDNITAYHMKLGAKVEQMLQAQSIAKSEKELITLQEALAIRKTDLLSKELDGYTKLAKQSGISVSQLMNYRLRQDYNKVMLELSRSNPSVQVKVDNSNGQ